MKRIRLTHVKGATVEREFVHCDQCDRELGKYEIGESPSEPHLCNTEICKMKTKTQPTPTIAELWRLFKMQVNSAQTAETLANVQRAEKGKRAKMLASKIDFTAKERHKYAESLRQQLVEWCSVPCYNFSASPLEEIEYHKEMSAIHGFWAWELEQREKEVQNG